MPRWGRRLRIVVVAAGLALLLLGTLWGSDDHFPFGPFRMYAGGGPINGTVAVTSVQARTADGRLVEVPETVSGLRPAEVEGRLDQFVKRPDLLQDIAAVHARRRPNESPYVGVSVVQRRHEIQDRRVMRVDSTIVVTWGSP